MPKVKRGSIQQKLIPKTIKCCKEQVKNLNVMCECVCVCVCVCLFSLFLGLHLRHTEVPKLGSKQSVAAGLCQSHSNARSEQHLQPTPQLTAMPDP